MTSRMASCDVYHCVSLFYFRYFPNSKPLLHILNNGCNKLHLTRVVLWTRLRVSFNAYVDPLYEFQVIYRALTRQPTTR
jgi:1-acyl-sn-glycerol-3-phosphate acyltransferase